MDTLPVLDLVRALAIIVLGASGTYLLLPHATGTLRPRQVHLLGAGLVGGAILLLATFWSPPGALLNAAFFYAFALAAVTGGILTITSRNPVYSALWFASVVLSTSGLFLLAGAPFLAAGTVIVYAGAIIVTFLFVIMLAQMGGEALYDRMARAPGRATFSCFLLLWSLLYAILLVRAPDDLSAYKLAEGVENVNMLEKRLVRAPRLVPLFRQSPSSSMGLVLSSAIRPTARLAPEGDTTQPHVASLGGTLYTDHLITVELAGALLFVALVGAVAIATPKAPIRPGDRAQPDSTRPAS